MGVLQKALCLLYLRTQPEAQAQQPVAGGGAAPGKDLMQIDLADAGIFGQRGL